VKQEKECVQHWYSFFSLENATPSKMISVYLQQTEIQAKMVTRKGMILSATFNKTFFRDRLRDMKP